MCSNSLFCRLLVSRLLLSRLLIFIILLFSFSFSVSANDEANKPIQYRNLYVELIGSTSVADIQVSTDLEEESTGFGALIGVRVTDFINIELGFIYHGEFNTQYAEDNATNASMRDRIGLQDMSHRGVSTSIRIGTKINANITESSYLFARFGMASWMIDFIDSEEEIDIFAMAENSDETGEGVYFGIGVAVRMNQRFDLGFEYNSLDMDNINDAFDIETSSFGLSLKANF